MGKLILITLLLCLTSVLTLAQEPEFDSKMAEDSTYRFYLDKDWYSLIAYGEEALKQDIDYYYLRIRMGIAYYELGKYRLATEHFEKAEQMNPFEEVATEYLYWCYVYSQRYEEAGKLSTKFSPETAKNTGTDKQKSLIFCMLESGIKLPDKSSLFDPLIYMQAGTGHRIRKQIYFFHAATWLNQKVYWGSYQQLEYYTKLTIPLSRGWSLSPAAHVMNLTASPYTKGTYFLGSAMATKQLTYFQLSAALSWSNIMGNSQVQSGAALRFFPFAHNKFWLETSANLLHPSSGLTGYYFQHTVSWAPSARWIFNGWFYHGNTTRFNEGNGYIINSSYDLLRNRSTFMTTFGINPHWDIYTMLQNEQKTEYFNNSNYQFNNFILGIKFKP